MANIKLGIAPIAWTNDDIYVTINTQTWSYNIFYSYKGRSYRSAYFE